jgi:hypothetical protein
VLVLLCIIVLLTLQLLSVHKYAKEVWESGLSRGEYLGDFEIAMEGLRVLSDSYQRN